MKLSEHNHNYTYWYIIGDLQSFTSTINIAAPMNIIQHFISATTLFTLYCARMAMNNAYAQFILQKQQYTLTGQNYLDNNNIYSYIQASRGMRTSVDASTWLLT